MPSLKLWQPGIERNMEVMREKDIEIREIILLGGGAKSDLWCRIIADMTGLPVVTIEQEENAALGAALLAGTATGLFCSLKNAVSWTIGIRSQYEPDEENYKRYREVYMRYLDLYSRVEDYWGSGLTGFEKDERMPLITTGNDTLRTRRVPLFIYNQFNQIMYQDPLRFLVHHVNPYISSGRSFY